MKQQLSFRAIALGCAAFLAVWLAVTWGTFQIIPAGRDPFIRNVFSPLSAFFLAAAAFGVWGFLRGHPWKMRPVVLGTTLPEDGRPALAIGRVRAVGRPLKAPITGTECVGYMYRMTDGGKLIYAGYRSVPFAIETAGSRYRVLAVPQLLSLGEKMIPGMAAVESARAFIRSTRFDSQPIMQSVVAQLKDIFTDDDGVAGRDWKSDADDRDPENLALHEVVLPVGAEVCALGTWSAAKQAITVGDGSAGVMGVTVTLGTTPKRGETDQHSLASYVFSTLFCAVAGVGLVWFARYLAETR